MDQLIKIIILAILQGFSELFPVSSLGHSVIIPAFLGWGNFYTNDSFLPILTVLHLGTTVALLAFYWRDWVALIRAFFKTVIAGRLDADPQGKTIWMVIVATIPIGIVGLLLQDPIQSLFFASQWPVLPAAFLFANGAVLYVVETLRQREEPAKLDRAKQEQVYATIADLTFKQALVIGCAQIFALLPGISRSGITMVAGMRARLSHEEALRFAFLLLAPVIGAASLLEIPKLIKAGHTAVIDTTIGSIIAAVVAYLSIRFLTRYFKVGRLTPFAFYCLGAGALSLVLFALLSLGVIHLPWA
ncbi:MAG TPA: undecaprenyl-diphosphate phosphatase [Ktedonobacterales bacterium]|nr:undecaprenyl-diphosphate phosphatase [Ktedonobacterales bacterium]